LKLKKHPSVPYYDADDKELKESGGVNDVTKTIMGKV
jgi:hypothetical protein